MRRSLAVLVILTVACSSTPSVGDYAAEVERLVVEMNGRIDAADEAFDAEATLEQARAMAVERIDARRSFISAFGDLTPPDEVAELHETTLELVTRLTDAEDVLMQRVVSAGSLAELGDLWDSPEGRAARAIDEETIALCIAAEEALDTTDERQDLGDVPWIPAEMTEVIQVVFGCRAEDRRN